MPSPRAALTTLALAAALLSGGASGIAAPPGYARTCVEDAQAAPSSPSVIPSAAPNTTLPPLSATLPLPAGVTGRVDFYAARLDAQGNVVQELTLGQPDDLHPMASSFKPLVVRAIFEDIDAGRFTPQTRLTTTEATRSLESYPAGSNTLAHLTDIAINGSNNTAADLLLLAHGPERLARSVHERSRCTSVLLTTKGWWTAQVGLAPGVLGGNTLAGAETYSALPFGERLRAAAQIIRAAQAQKAPVISAALDRSYLGRGTVPYTPLLDLDLQNTTTPRAYAPLVAGTLSGDGLSPASRARLRTILSTGCCRPEHPTLPVSYWGAKGGITGRVFNLTGLVELRGGTLLVYVYMNDLSDTLDSAALRRNAPPVVLWIERQLARLGGS